MKKRKFLCIVLSFHMLFCMGGCVQAPRETETKARFCPENDIITYEPVDFNKTVITIGTYAPCNSDPVELAIEAQFPDVDIVVL